jgi:pimeloyl-ACP methyl ester carboxylesterase
VRWTIVSIVVLLVVGYAGIGWYVSGQVIDGMSAVPEEVVYDTTILAVGPDTVTIQLPNEKAAQFDHDAVMGLKWAGGWAIVQPATTFDTTQEVRPYELVEATAIPVGSNVADFDSLVFPGDPSSVGVDFQTVTFTAPLGDLSAWYVPGEGDTWLIAVHGLGAGQRDALRLLEATKGAGYPTLVPQYRNDVGAPQTKNQLGMMGQTEWEDLAAAIDYAKSQGATSVILDGISMGGGVVLGYLVNAPDASIVHRAILESPLANFRQVIDLRSGEALPVGGIVGDSFLAVGRMFVQMRTGLSFARVDYVAQADELDVPILLFHGTDDDKVPYAVGKALADARPDLIDLVTVNDAAHVRAWNEDPAGYRAAVLEFMAG